MTVLSVISLFVSFIYARLGLYAYRLGGTARLNRLFFLLSSAFAIWAFSYAFLYSAVELPTVWFWFRVSAVGWCSFGAVSFHFALALTGRERLVRSWFTGLALYLPAAIFLLRAWTSTLTAQSFVFYAPLWWVEVANVSSPWFWAFTVYYVLCLSGSLALVIGWGRATRLSREKKQAGLIIASAGVVFILGGLTNAVFPLLEIRFVPALAPVFMLLWAYGCYRAITVYRLLSLTPVIAFEEILARMEDFLILTDPRLTITAVNPAFENFSGYEGVELCAKPLNIILLEEEVIEQFPNSLRDSPYLFHKRELTVKAKSGEMLPVSLSCSAVRDRSRELIGLVLVAQDLRPTKRLLEEIVIRKRTENALLRAQEGLETRIKERTRELGEANELLRNEIRERQRTEQLLTESEVKYRTLFDHANDAICLLDGNLIVDCNRYTIDLFGFSQDQCTGETFDRLSPAAQLDGRKSREVLSERLSKALQGIPQVFEFRHLRFDGTPFDAEVSFNRIELGSKPYVQAIIRDITERKQAAEITRMQRDLGVRLSMSTSLVEALHAVFETALSIEGIDSGGLYLIDGPTGTMSLMLHTGLSEEFIDLVSRYDRTSARMQIVMTGKPIYLCHEEFADTSHEDREKEGLRGLGIIPISSEGQVIACLHVASHREPSISIFARNALETISSQIGGVLARLSAEKALQESEEKFRALFEESMDAIYISTVDGRLLDMNGAAFELFGYSGEESRQANVMDIYLYPTDRERFMFEVDQNGFVRDFELKLKKKNGETIDCLVSARARQGEGGVILGYQGIIKDITARKKMEEALRTSEQRLIQIIGYLPDPTFVINSEGRVIAWNRAIEEMTGIKAEAMRGKGGYEYALPFYGERRPILVDLALNPDNKEIPKKYPFVERTGETLHTETFVKGKGTGAYLWATARPLYDASDRIVGAIETIRDNTEARRAGERLNQERERFFALIEHAPVGMMMVDRDGRFLYLNRKWKEVFGYSLEDVPDGRTLFRKVFPNKAYRHKAIADWSKFAREEVSEETERTYSLYCKDGVRKTISFVMVPLESGQYLLSCEDISARVLYEEKLNYLATHDTLTGLLNRHSLEEATKRSTAMARRGRKGCLLYMDLDNFKTVNDTLGHHAGDHVLVTLSGILKQAVRLEDTIFRIGGDEFAVLLEGTAREEALNAAERIRDIVEHHPFQLDSHVFTLTFTIGLISIDGTLDPTVLLSKADVALYRGKAKGRNMVVIYDPKDD